MTRKTKKILGFVLRLALGLCFVTPLLIGFAFSFLPNEILDGIPTANDFLEYFTVENYKWVFKNIPVLRYVTNSLVMCVVIIVAQVIISSLAAYAFSFFKFKGKDFLFQLILIAMMIPGQVVTIANFITIQGADLLNSYVGLCLPYMIGGTAIFMMRQYYLTIPKELKEASMLDGCSDMRFLFQIAVPLSVPTIAALGIYLFIDVYNMYLWPLLVGQNQNMFTVQIGMSMLVNSDATQYGRILAGAMISIAIPVITFFIGQDYLIKGMTSGSVKG